MGGTVTTGWHADPFEVHEARYFNADGQPTKLVRDRGLESYDEPPSAPDEVAAAMARLLAPPEPPSAYPPRDPHPYDRAAERNPWRPSFRRFAVTLAVAVAAAVVIVLVAQSMMRAPKPGSTPGTSSAPGGATDVAFVTQAATRTLQQHTVDLTMSGGGAAGGASDSVQATGAFDLGGKSGTLNMTMAAKGYTLAYRTIYVNGYVYVGMSVNGVSLMPAGKTWIAEQQQASATQGSGLLGLTGTDPTAELASLENQGITVSALGTKDIGGVSCTGYAVTVPGTQNTVTVWINQQHLMREISINTTVGFSVSGSSASVAPTGTSSTVSVDLTMDFAYSAAPVHVTAPPAASTMSLDAFLNQLTTNPALKQLETSAPSSGATTG